MYHMYTTIAPVFPDKIFFQVETDLINYNEGSCVPNWLKARPHLQIITATATSVVDFLQQTLQSTRFSATQLRSGILVVKNGEICMESRYNSKFY